MKINVKIVVSSDKSSAVATLFGTDNRPVMMTVKNSKGVEKEKPVAGTTKGRRSEDDANKSAAQIAFDRLINKMANLGILPESATIESFAVETVVGETKPNVSKPKVNLSNFNLAGIIASAPTPAAAFEKRAELIKDQKIEEIEGQISAMNAATGTDFGVVTAKSNHQAYVQTAVESIETAATVTAALEEDGLGTSDVRTMSNALAEQSGARGPFRKDSNGESELHKAGLEDPTIAVTVHRPASVTQSMNQRHGVAGLRTTEKDMVQMHAGSLVHLNRKTAGNRSAGQERDAVAGELGKLYGQSTLMVLGHGNLLAGRVLATHLDEEGRKFKSRARGGFAGLCAYQIGYIVSCLRRNVTDSTAERYSEDLSRHGFAINLRPDGLVSLALPGEQTGTPIVWDLTETELAAVKQAV